MARDILEQILASRTDRDAKNLSLELTSRGAMHIDVPYCPERNSTRCCAATMVPTPLCLEDYEEVERLQGSLNKVCYKLSRDRETIIRHLTVLADHDSFAQDLLNIYKDLPDSHHEKITLALNRHDFMYDTPDPSSETAFLNGQFKLVENNLIAASMGALTESVYWYHRSLLRRYGVHTSQHDYKMNNIKGLAGGLKLGYDLYKDKFNSDNCFVVMVQEDDSFNYFDQQLVFNAVEELGAPTVRVTTLELLEHGRVQEGRFTVHDMEVAVFYFRTMFNPWHYPTPEYWSLRRDMELSNAISVPNVAHQIVNLKYFQMLLAQKEVLERYTTSLEEADSISKLFIDTLPLQINEEGNRNAQLAINNPDKYVLKPQREGGGNNLWNEEMRETLMELQGNPTRARFILMKKITPPVIRNRFVKRGVMSEELETVAEIGLYSVFCTDSTGSIVRNEVVGPLVRTKNSLENEGGVLVGISAIDSPLFVSSHDP